MHVIAGKTVTNELIWYNQVIWMETYHWGTTYYQGHFGTGTFTIGPLPHLHIPNIIDFPKWCLHHWIKPIKKNIFLVWRPHGRLVATLHVHAITKKRGESVKKNQHRTEVGIHSAKIYAILAAVTKTTLQTWIFQFQFFSGFTHNCYATTNETSEYEKKKNNLFNVVVVAVCKCSLYKILVAK